MPDQFRNEYFPMVKPPGWDSEAAFIRLQTDHHPGTVDPMLEKVLAWMQRPADHADGGLGGVERIGAIGYCFGGRYVMRLLAQGKIEAGVVNHPSFFTLDEVSALGRPSGDKVDGGEGDGKKAKVWKPLAIFAAETDDILPEEKRRATEDRLKEGGVTWMCTTYSDTEHGFRYVRPSALPAKHEKVTKSSIRGDLGDPLVKFARDSAMDGAVKWFNQYLPA
jgi:dienelactone hydrolase